MLNTNKKQALLFFALLLPISAFGQAVRYDIPPILTSAGKPVSLPVISLCAGTATISGTACSPATAQSVTDITTNTLCPIGSPVTLTGLNTCQATGDTLGNAGFWLKPGAYIYCITGPGITGACYNLTVPIGISSSGSATITGALTAQSVNSVLWVGGTSGFTTMQACVNALPSTGGICNVIPNYAETLAANLVMAGQKVIQFTGPANITMGSFQVTSASAKDGWGIITPYARSLNGAGTCTGVCFKYNGSSAAFSLGDSSNFLQNITIKGVGFDLSSASANATGLLLTNVAGSAIDDNACTGGAVSGQVCIKTAGVGAFYTGLDRISGTDCGYSASSTNGVCIQIGDISNVFQIIGGHGNMGGSANGSVCIDVKGPAASRVGLWMFDCDVSQTAVTVESTSENAIYGYLGVDSGTTNTANFAASTNGNHLFLNGSKPVTDSGVAGTNSVERIRTNQVNTAFFAIRSDSVGWFVNDQVGGTSPIVVASNGFVSLNPTGANQLLFLHSSGTAGMQQENGSGTAVLQWDANGTMHPAVAQAVGLGTAALPFGNLRVGNCSSSASPAVCGAAAAGSVVVAAGATSVQVNTTAVTANSQIFIQPDDSLGTKLSVTCNTTGTLLDAEPWVSARTGGTSFTITVNAAPSTNPECLSYFIVN